MRWMGSLLAALLLIALSGVTPAAAAPCPEGAVTAMSASDAVAVAIDAGHESAPCPEGCAACFHCQSHHVTANVPALEPVAARFAKPQRHAMNRALGRDSSLIFQLKRPPRI